MELEELIERIQRWKARQQSPDGAMDNVMSAPVEPSRPPPIPVESHSLEDQIPVEDDGAQDYGADTGEEVYGTQETPDHEQAYSDSDESQAQEAESPVEIPVEEEETAGEHSYGDDSGEDDSVEDASEDDSGESDSEEEEESSGEEQEEEPEHHEDDSESDQDYAGDEEED